MKYIPKGTIRYFMSIPHVVPQNLAHLPMKTAMKSVKDFWKSKVGADKAYPDVEAITFYALDHLAAKIQAKFSPDEVLPEWAQEVMEAYVRVLSAQATRNYAYMMLIITRESRHIHNPDAAFYQAFPDAFRVWHRNNVCGHDSMGVAEMVATNPPDVTLGEYVSCIEAIFSKGKFSSSYGGKPWANIAATVRRMVHGETSLLVMVDTAYTLAHNGGPQYNKGMLYHGYTNEFLKILDVQRGGQIPEAVISGEFSKIAVPNWLSPLIFKVKEALPGVCGDSVDWAEVSVKCGHPGKYALKAKKAVPPGPPKPVTFGGKPAKLKGHWAPLPFVQVEMMERSV